MVNIQKKLNFSRSILAFTDIISTFNLANILTDYFQITMLSERLFIKDMIKLGYTFHLVDGMITNFHQPKSTLLLLVSAFVDGHWMYLYDYALANDFRFLSYGDSSLLLR